MLASMLRLAELVLKTTHEAGSGPTDTISLFRQRYPKTSRFESCTRTMTWLSSTNRLKCLYILHRDTIAARSSTPWFIAMGNSHRSHNRPEMGRGPVSFIDWTKTRLG